MLRVEYFDRQTHQLQTVNIPGDVLAVVIPEQDKQPPLRVTVNTDAVLVDVDLDVDHHRVAMYEYIDLLADYYAEQDKDDDYEIQT